MIATTALNLRLRPGFDDTLRGCLRKGDVVTIMGTQRVAESGFTFVPVLVWVAETCLQPLERGKAKIGQKYEDIHIFHELSTVIPYLSTGFNCFGVPLGCVFPRKMVAFP